MSTASVTGQAVVQIPGYVCGSKCSEQRAKCHFLPGCYEAQAMDGRKAAANK
jgi:hypothetical protein